MSNVVQIDSLAITGVMAKLISSNVNAPFITSHQLALLLFKLYKDRTFEGASLRIRKELPSRLDLSRVCKSLVSNGVLKLKSGAPANVYQVAAYPEYSPTEEIACCADPFCYVSHLSAMGYHGLTDRLPSTLTLTTFLARAWRIAANAKMQKEIGDDLPKFLQSGLPTLQRIRFTKLYRRQVRVHQTEDVRSFISVRDRAFRVSSIGRTFLDMLRQPSLCGGMSHVSNIFQEHSSRYRELIISEVNAHGRPIEKVRTGYLMEAAGIQDSRLESWLNFVQRGGSRKLDPEGEYSPQFSARWGISLNLSVEADDE